MAGTVFLVAVSEFAPFVRGGAKTCDEFCKKFSAKQINRERSRINNRGSNALAASLSWDGD